MERQAGTKAIIDALNVAYDEKEKRSFIRLNLVSLLYTLIAIVVLMLAVGAVVVAPIVLGVSDSAASPASLIGVVRWPVLLVLVIVRPRRGLPLHAVPAGATLGVVERRKRVRRNHVVRGLAAVLVVHRQFRLLQRDLRLAGRSGRHDDVDVDLDAA